MTLLKAYLMGSDDPYVMAEIYLNQILKMPIQAIEEETERLMSQVTGEEDANLSEEFEEVSYIIEEIKENLKDARKMVQILSREGEQETHPKLPKWEKDVQELTTSYLKWERELSELKREFNLKLRDLTGVDVAPFEYQEGKFIQRNIKDIDISQ